MRETGNPGLQSAMTEIPESEYVTLGRGRHSSSGWMRIKMQLLLNFSGAKQTVNAFLSHLRATTDADQSQRLWAAPVEAEPTFIFRFSASTA